MSFVRLSEVSFSYRDPIDILEGLSFAVHRGWTGVVGPNGGGKSTLLGLLAGQLRPTRGQVLCEPGDAIIHLCPQRVERMSAAIRSFGDAWTRADVRWRARLGLDPEQLDRWPCLSSGERKRWQIGAALAARPDVLLLDEPSNHLDDEARALLCDALVDFRGVGVVVAHDRALLDQLTTHTVRVQRGTAQLYRGSYSDAGATWRAEEHALRERHARVRKREVSVNRRLADERRKRAGAERSISVKHRSKGPKDSDARTAMAKNRAMSGEARHGRQVALLRREAGRIQAQADDIQVVRERGGALFIDYEPAPRRHLMALDGVDLCAGEHVLARSLRVAIERGSRIHLAGPNGAGKSTLLAALHRTAAHPERILYLPQTTPSALGVELLAALRALDSQSQGRVLQLAAALGLEPARVLASEAPSPGELRKLAIARGLGLGAWAVILDEPTNHLDLPSIERLEAALAEYPGALLLASHDRVFARAVTDTGWRLRDGRLDVGVDIDADVDDEHK